MSIDESHYQEALDYIYSFVDYSRDRSQRYSADAFDLARMRRLLKLLGDPHKRYPTVLIAGTKGKGSVAAMLESCFRQGGYRTGLYTSPHLVRFRERIQIDRVQISPSELVALVEELKPAVEVVPDLTTYELITALGLLHFERSQIQIGVIEVGLGGRLDATNVLSPVVSVITNISFDHTGILGETLPEIAAEKAGIIKPGIPVVMAPQVEQAGVTIRKFAQERGAELIDVAKGWRAEVVSASLEGQELRVRQNDSPPGSETRMKLALLGPHQVTNSLTALAALHACADQGLKLSEVAVYRGMARVVWAGRFQVLSRRPAVVADAAHNRASAAVLRATVQEYFPGSRPILVFGASGDKDVKGMLAELAPVSEKLIATQAFHPRALEPDRICEMSSQYHVPCRVLTPVSEAMRSALRSLRHDGLVLVAGSLFVVGEVLDAWPELSHVLGQLEGIDE